MKRARRQTRSRGFSLLELMVALTVGGIAITSIYAVGSASSRHFREQERVSATQSSLRMAIDQVKRDIARAGYLATPNAEAPDQLCEPINPNLVNGTKFAAIAAYADNVPISVANNNTAVDPTGNNAVNGFSVDSVTLIANYSTNSEYSGIEAAGPNTIALQQNWYAFQRDFTRWSEPPAIYLDKVLEDAFLAPSGVPRAVRVQTAGRKRFFSTVSSVTHPPVGTTDDVNLTLGSNLGGCMTDVSGGWIAPLTTLRYWVQNAAGIEAERFVGTEGPVALLLRTEVSPTGNKTAPIGPSRTVLDHVVSFNLDFTVTSQQPPGQPDNYVVGNWLIPAQKVAVVNSNPELVRAVRITLGARTPQIDPRFQWTQPGCANLRCFEVFNDRPGAARVRWLQTEVFVPNIAFEGY